MKKTTQSTRAILLSHENFGEADRYIQFLTQDWGVITVLAKSARKSKRRYVGGLDLFCHDEISVRGNPRERPYLVELTVLNAFMGLRDDIARTLAAGKVVQWVRKIADTATPMPGIYSILGQTLALMEKESDPGRLELLGLIFKLKLLAQLGLKPRLEACVRCSEPPHADEPGEAFYFDIESGGLVCRVCVASGGFANRLRLPSDERLMLANADRLRLTSWQDFDFPSEKTNHLLRLTTQFASFHTHARLPV